MSNARPLAAPLEPIDVKTRNFYMRPLTIDDASDRWASWFDQPEVREALNMKPGRKTKADIEKYISTFDQRNNVLVGMFDRTNDLLVGIIDVEINWQIGRYLANMVVGEPDYRHRGVTLEISPGFRTYFFETLGLKIMTATALSTNKAIANYLKKTGWTLNQVLKNHTRSHFDGSPVDLHLWSITREAWAEWKQSNAEMLRKLENGEVYEENRPK
jgi:RimJ/RimL family protein N-acetyltransferase